MKYGVTPLGIVPMRLEPSHRSEMVSQLLYGEFFAVVEKRSSWIRICTYLDNYQGWVDEKQIVYITDKQMKTLSRRALKFTMDNSRVQDTSDTSVFIPKGSLVSSTPILKQRYKGKRFDALTPDKIVQMAMSYLNTPYLWGGRTPFGIDCSGFVQMVYRLCGITIPRDASQQVKHGKVLSFLEECSPGDLAFFDDENGQIIHVGIVLADHQIIHAHGRVRIDSIDHGGIYNFETNQYSHHLRVLKTFR